MAKVVENSEKMVNVGIKFVNSFKKDWKWWIAGSIFIFVMALMTIACIGVIQFIHNPVLPDTVFEQYQNWEEDSHSISTEYRIANAPAIRSYLNELVLETGADRAYVAEFHNGKNNPSGLQWQYADMTFINDAAIDICDEYTNVSLVKYNLANTLFTDGSLYITTEDVLNKDKKLALRLEANDAKSIGAVMMYGENLVEIGFVGITFCEDTNKSNTEIIKILNKYASKISPLLDGKQAKKKA